eukprot:g32336.t1
MQPEIAIRAQQAESEEWTTLRAQLCTDERNQLLLDVFENAYGVRNCSDALLNVQDFLGRFLVKEFDHEGFRKILSEEEIDVDVDADLAAASTLSLRMVMMIAKIYHLRTADWQDVICGSVCAKLCKGSNGEK